MTEKASVCRSCGGARLDTVLDLGRTPLADALLREEELGRPEPEYPLKAVFCRDCSLVQILETVPPEELFCRRYPYYSSFSDELLGHSRENAIELIRTMRLNAESLVVEIASNDGYLLRNFVQNGIPCLGIDPAEGPAEAAERAGVPTHCGFFNRELAAKLRGMGKRADVVIANNVLAHVADSGSFLDGIRTLLKDDGAAVIEVPYVRDLVDKSEFDTIYHEHLCYFSATSADRLLRSRALFLNSVRRIPIHGGSLRLYIGLRDEPDASITGLLAEEKRDGVDGFSYYNDFAVKAENIKNGLRLMLKILKDGGNRIAAYGAAAKGATLLNYTGIGRDFIDFVVDRNVHKQGLYMPGRRIPIFRPERLLEERPDYVLILAWNFAQEIISQQEEYRAAGGKFIVPIPEWKVT
ncbi:MAG: class I SAM-dependent methyltransferase [Deltaproteobacteria bacterium]|nr:class I SAM-dependent methyltransferase [Deltaproteobacteria bacterium]MCL4872574.1 methyltransferase domain-containing protein [bacterium]